eukprot:1159146-Pelagomonas_calceolata.AAC.9
MDEKTRENKARKHRAGKPSFQLICARHGSCVLRTAENLAPEFSDTPLSQTRQEKSSTPAHGAEDADRSKETNAAPAHPAP